MKGTFAAVAAFAIASSAQAEHPGWVFKRGQVVAGPTR